MHHQRKQQVILIALGRATVSSEAKNRTECHKLNVISSNGTCPYEGQFLVPGNCTIYIDCISNGSEIIPHEFHCSMGYFNGTRCTKLDEMILNCPQTDCFSDRAGNVETMKEYIVEFEANHTQSPMRDHDSAIVTDSPSLPESSTNSSMVDMLESQKTENVTTSTMKTMEDEPVTQNQAAMADTMEKEDTVVRMETPLQLEANKADSSNETEMIHPSSSLDRHGRLLIKDMRPENTRNKSMTETTFNSSHEHPSTTTPHDHHHEHHQAEGATTSTATHSPMKAPVTESNTMTSTTAKPTSGTEEMTVKGKPAELQQMKSMKTNSGISSTLQNPKILLLAVILTVTIF